MSLRVGFSEDLDDRLKTGYMLVRLLKEIRSDRQVSPPCSCYGMAIPAVSGISWMHVPSRVYRVYRKRGTSHDSCLSPRYGINRTGTCEPDVAFAYQGAPVAEAATWEGPEKLDRANVFFTAHMAARLKAPCPAKRLSDRVIE